jgi:Cu-Zn family superoxide dismutase
MDGAMHPDHAGDLPPVLVGLDGMGELMVVTDRFVLEDLMDEDGSAIVIHSNADNFANIPERYGTPDEETLAGGDSGERVACGVIQEDAGMTAG